VILTYIILTSEEFCSLRKLLIKNTDRLCRSQKHVGTKATNLALLLKNGYPVPPFFVVPTKVFSHFYRECKKTNKDSINHKKAKNFLSSIEFGSKYITSAFWKKFESLFSNLQQGNSAFKVSVRSSSPLEDQATQSFAGQFETYLDVKDLETAWKAVKKCWFSLWQPNVISYLQRTNLNHKYAAMAVIVQKMVHPNASGVLFSREPVSNDDSKMLIEFSFGAPDDVVSGKVNPWRIRIDKKTKKISWLSPTHETKKNRKQSDNIEELLTIEKIQQLIRIGEKLEIQLNCSVDIEWAIEKGKLWLLQVRPLTTAAINDRQRRDKNGDLWTDYFFVERFVDPVTPLGWSIIGKWIEERALREPLHFLGFDKLNQKKNITRLFDSFPYTRIEVFQSMYSVIPDFAISEDKKLAFLNTKSRRLWVKNLIWRLPFIFSRLIFRDINWFPPLHLRLWQRFINRYSKQLKENRPDLDSLDFIELGQWFNRIELLTDEFLTYHRWSITFADLFFHLLEILLPVLHPDLKSLNIADLISGLPGNKTVQANLELSQLASSLNINVKQKKKFDVQQLKEIPGFQNQFNLFLKRHGHRSQNLDPYYPPWRHNSDFIEKTIVDLVTNPKTGAVIEKSQRQANNNRIEAENFLFTSILKSNSPLRLLKKSLLKSILGNVQSFALLRENQRYYWHFALEEKRRIILETGGRLVERNILSFPEQIFFLQRREFLQCFEPNAELSFLRQKTEKRFKKWKRSGAATKIEYKAQKKQEGKSSELQGLGVSAGKIQGKAYVVRSLAEAQKMKPGGILVTGSVDPAWTPVFAKAGGLVLEVGGILSHASIVAREFRLPAVTSVAGATSIIKDDLLLEIDGTTGTVTILRE